MYFATFLFTANKGFRFFRLKFQEVFRFLIFIDTSVLIYKAEIIIYDRPFSTHFKHFPILHKNSKFSKIN